MADKIALVLHHPGQRLDRALAAAYPALSRTQWQERIQAGAVMVEGQPARASLRLTGGEVVEAWLPTARPTTLEPEAIPLDIRYEDEDMLVINKPAGMVVHPAAGHAQGTVVNAVLAHCPDLPGISGEKRPGIVHRLDKNTSGLLLVAKHDGALRHLQGQFKGRQVEKVYRALVQGQIQPEQAIIDAPIGRDPQRRQQMAVIPPASSASSRMAVTFYVVLHRYTQFVLVEVRPQTGRTHQIRVHLAYLGYPIVNDTLYGPRRPALADYPFHFLHAQRLTFRRPADNQPLTLEAELPAGWQAALASLST